jgi:hypothetical protein
MNAPLPAQIGRFRIEALLGKGAMGVVYKAHDPEIDRPVAIKLIHAELLQGDSRQGYLARFRNEAKVAGRCVHSNIVAVYDYSVQGDSPYLVMEYVEGREAARAAAELEILTRALAQVMGPIAPLLIQRVQARTASTAELDAACAAMIDDPRQQQRFAQLLKQYRTGAVSRPKG